MLELSKIPAFGFETQSIQAKTIYDDYAAKGYPKRRRDVNISKILGYIPVVGMITGLGNIFAATEKQQRFSKHFVIRAAFEIAGLGIVFLFADLIMLLVRSIQAKGNRVSYKVERIPLPAKEVETQHFSEKIANFYTKKSA